MAKRTSKRIKADKPLVIPIENWDEADEIIKRIGELQRQIVSHEQKCDDKIDKAKADLINNTKELLDRVKLHSQSLEAFAVNHRSDLGKAKSKKLVYGLLGWRSSTKISIKKTTVDLIKKVFGRSAGKYLNVTETANKEALKLLKDEQLAKVEAQRKGKEAFFVEPESQKAIDNEDKKSAHS